MPQQKKHKISEFRPQVRNSNKHTSRGLGALDQSIAECGWIGSITTAADGEVFDGSARLETVYTRFGENVEPIVIESDGTRPVILKRTDIPNAEDPKAKKLSVAANRIAQIDLQWDAEILAELNDEVDLSGLFSDEELNELLEQVGQGVGAAISPEEDEENTADLIDKAESGEIESRVSLGQVWKLGRHYIACGDSTKEENIRALMRIAKVQSVDMMWTDPPYGVSVVGGSKDPRAKTHKSGKSIANDDITGDELRVFLKSAFAAVDPYMRNGACYYVAHPDIFAYEFIGAIRDVGWRQARPPVVLWIKNTFVFGQGDYHSRSEPILYGWKPGGAHKAVSDRTQDNVWEFDRPTNVKDIHPSVKPLELVARAVVNSSEEGWIIYDPFLGSGTTLIASHQHDRNCLGFELSPEYCEVVCQRFEKLAGVNAELVGSL